jgi:2,5-diketo-D-gluconate reductase B
MMTAATSAIPQLGLGTFGRTGDAGMAAILSAIELGYRHLDTAQSYDSERPVGEAIRRSGLPREEIFITTKVADSRLRRAEFGPSVDASLAALGVDAVDLLLIHWPSQGDAVPLEEYLTALAEAQQAGQARLIGVSNFTIDHLERARAILGPGALATNQVEIHPYLQAPRLRDHARAQGLQLTAYEPLVRGRVAEDPVLAGIGERHGVGGVPVTLAFLMAEGHVVIPASSNPKNLAANLKARDLRLDAEEMAAIRRLDRGLRTINPAKAPTWDD